MESHLREFVPHTLCLFLLIHLCLAAPGLPGTQGEDSVGSHTASTALINPFSSGEEDRRLLQSYIQSSLKDGQGGPEINTWEQEVFFLFRLYDYDRSGFLDGLEMMKLLSDYNSHHTPGEQPNDLVVSMVDFLLQTQDLNQDGLLAPSELLSPSLPHTQGSSINEAPHQDMAVDGEPLNPEEVDRAAEQGEGVQHDTEPQGEAQSQQEVKTEEDSPPEPLEEQNRQQVPEAAAAEEKQHYEVPVHQGQPEI